MATTGISTLDHAPQVFAEWLNELREDLGWPEKPRAYLLLHETLHAIRDFLTVDEAADLAAQLPVLVRGVFYRRLGPIQDTNQAAEQDRSADPHRGAVRQGAA